jgi:hypothetical protein
MSDAPSAEGAGSFGDPYQLVGKFQTFEVDRLIERLEIANIDYQIEMNNESIIRMDPVTAASGGTFGSGAGVNFYVHENDLEKARPILDAFNEGSGKEN